MKSANKRKKKRGNFQNLCVNLEINIVRDHGEAETLWSELSNCVQKCFQLRNKVGETNDLTLSFVGKNE